MAALPQLLYFAVERVDGAAEAAGRARWRVEHHLHGGTQDARIGAVVAQSGLESVVGDPIAARMGDALDEPMQSQAAQVVGHAIAP